MINISSKAKWYCKNCNYQNLYFF